MIAAINLTFVKGEEMKKNIDLIVVDILNRK